MNILLLSKRCAGVFLLTTAVIAAAFVSSCQGPAANQTTDPVANTTANSNTQTSAQPSPAAADEQAASTAFTLPLLDALLVDEQFVSQVRTDLQLTDAEIQKLRESARNGVDNLTDDAAEDDSRSTKAASEEARKQIRQVLGDERGNRLIAHIGKHVSGGGELAAVKPNSVPSDTRIVVNTPAYRMDVFQEGKLVKSYKVGIGYPEFPLPTGLRSAKSIIFNPTWTPPDEPWVKGKVSPGQKVEAGSELNPLGPIKIPIGAPSLIHGGKSPARLGTFASHGCVGLTNAQVQDFAMKLANLSGKPITLQDVKSYEKTKTETKEVKLEQPIPVELRYETIVLENGSLKIYRDVYEKGTNTEENLRRVLEHYGVSLDNLQPEVRQQLLDALQQMSLDAKGQPVTPTDAQASKKTANSNKGSGKVTSTIKGKKEVVLQLPELAGKGYPAPKDMTM
ncbi:MAG: L,D-transpeptidase [Pyrinomonadaceae bacterium]